jgi:hypothetical protein
MIDWSTFPLVVGAALVAACVLVTLFSVALRVGDGSEPWRRPASVALYVLCGTTVALGIYLIVPALHALG